LVGCLWLVNQRTENKELNRQSKEQTRTQTELLLLTIK